MLPPARVLLDGQNTLLWHLCTQIPCLLTMQFQLGKPPAVLPVGFAAGLRVYEKSPKCSQESVGFEIWFKGVLLGRMVSGSTAKHFAGQQQLLCATSLLRSQLR